MARFALEHLPSARGNLVVALLSGALRLILKLVFFDGVAFGVVMKRLLVILPILKRFTQRELQIHAILATEMGVVIQRLHR